MLFSSIVKTILYPRALAALLRKTLILIRENFTSSSHRLIFFLLYRQTDFAQKKKNRGKAGNGVINIFTGEDMENKKKPWRGGSEMSFIWILLVVYFPVKHSCPYIKREYLEWPLLVSFYEKEKNCKFLPVMFSANNIIQELYNYLPFL